MLFKRYESTEIDRRTWLHVPSGTHWSTSSDTHQVVEIQIETSTKMYTPFTNYLRNNTKTKIIGENSKIEYKYQRYIMLIKRFKNLKGGNKRSIN